MNTKRKAIALLCAAALSAGMCAPYAHAADQAEVLRSLAAMGVLNGDEKGNLNLSDNVTRAAFVKMAVAASVYKDMATSSAYVSPFSDVNYRHWAAGYVKTAVDAQWINGYLDGTFRPDSGVKLEEAVNICLKMLGYTDADFTTGTFPAPQLALYQNLKLNTNISAVRGQSLTRTQCAQLIYNTLNATSKSGQVYATTLGYKVDTAGNVDYLSIVNSELKGPYIVGADGAASILGFTPQSVYRNDTLSDSASIERYDVLYYLEKTKTVWVYHNRVTGTYEAAQPSRSNPTSVVVSGVTYPIESAAAAYDLSTTGDYKIGDTLTLLLGRDNGVAAVIEPSESAAASYGVVIAVGTSNYTDAQGKPYTASTITVLGVDGTTYTYQDRESGYYKEDDLVRIVYRDGVAKPERITTAGSGTLTGAVNAAGTQIGQYRLADDVKILDYSEGAAVTVQPSRIANVRLDAGDVAYYELNGAGEISVLILKNVTGDMLSYALVSQYENIYTTNPITGGRVVAGQRYTLLNGRTAMGPFVGQDTIYPISAGNVVGFRLNKTNSGMEQLSVLKNTTLLSLTQSAAVTGDGRRFSLLSDVSVYRKQQQTGLDAQYHVISIDEAINGSYRLTGWYDSLESEGGKLRVIVAEET